MVIDYDKYWFNPLFYHIRKYSQDPEIRYIWVYGGKSSSKTFSIIQLFEMAILESGFNVAAFRRELARMKDGVRFDAIGNLDICNLRDAFDVYEYTLSCNQYPKEQANFRMKGLEDEKAIKGVAGFKWILLDELDQFEKKVYTQTDASHRGLEDQKLFATWNPISENHWIKTDIIDQKEWDDLPKYVYPPGHLLHNVSTLSDHSTIQKSSDGMMVLIKTNFFDNKMIFGGEDNGFTYGRRDENFIKLYLSYEFSDPDFYEINVLGNWGVVKADNPFIRNLNHNTQVGECYSRYLTTEPVYISMDFNEKWTALIEQRQGDEILYLKCYHDYPETLMEQIALEFGHWEAYFTGDFSGNSKTQYTSDESKKTAWALVKKYYNKACRELYGRDEYMQERGYTNFKSVPQTGNISHSNSRTISNALLFHWGKNVTFDKIHCKVLLDECKKIPATAQGGLDKAELNRKNIGHWLDTLRYNHAYFHYQEFKQINSAK